VQVGFHLAGLIHRRTVIFKSLQAGKAILARKSRVAGLLPAARHGKRKLVGGAGVGKPGGRRAALENKTGIPRRLQRLGQPQQQIVADRARPAGARQAQRVGLAVLLPEQRRFAGVM
jgi:hypothetical protein